MLSSRLLLTRHRLLILAILIGLTLLFFQRIAFSGMIMARGDVYSYFYPYWDVRSAAFRAGQFPLWSPQVFMGVPLLANSQLGTFYPPNWLLTAFDAPDAIMLSLLTHTIWAMLGMYVFTRRTIGLDHVPALLSAALFGLGGYLGGQSEHINQLQALSWLPWLFLTVRGQLSSISQSPTANRQPLTARILSTRYSVLITRHLPLSLLIALQLLAGHPQTVFITLVGLAVYVAVVGFQGSANSQSTEVPPKRIFPFNLYRLTFNLIHLAFSTVFALLLAAPQLVPTLELALLSNRSGGLDAQRALAFSFPPLLIGRGLLPSYDSLLFGEYIAYVGVIGLGLAVVGVFSRHSTVNSFQPTANRQPLIASPLTPYIILLIVAFLLALGAYNPLNWLLANLPGFSFFRVPARWLALLAFSVALLAGAGLQSLYITRPRRRALVLVILLMGGLAFSSLLAGQAGEDVIGPAIPTLRTWAGWGVAFVILLLLLFRAPFSRHSALGTRYSILTLVLALAELFLASQIMPYNQLAPKDVYTASRFTIRQLQVYVDEQTPPGRFLSISPLEFDPGDVGALETRYTALGMNEFATRVALVATKLREVVAPNLALTWGLHSLDGFDGGLLPTGYYSDFTSLLLPPGADPTSDGRLREMLALPECRGACIPEQRWLNLSNTRYLIADKTADAVRDGVFYDLTFTIRLGAGQSVTLHDVPPFQATAVDVLYTCVAAGCRPPVVRVETREAAPKTVDTGGEPEPTPVDAFLLARLPLANPATPVTISVQGVDEIDLRAVTLVDRRTGVFQQVSLPPWRRVLSSDIKLYENSAVLPRAFLVQEVQTAADDAAALALLRAADFDPARTAILISESIPITPAATQTKPIATITHYTAERIEITVKAGDAPALLMLTDAYYPGWIATVNDQPTPILRADILFRAVPVPAGDSAVVFEYRPWWWPGVLMAGVLLWLAGLGVLVWGQWSIRKSLYNEKDVRQG